VNVTHQDEGLIQTCFFIASTNIINRFSADVSLHFLKTFPALFIQILNVKTKSANLSALCILSLRGFLLYQETGLIYLIKSEYTW